jgi:hypothetical protein
MLFIYVCSSVKFKWVDMIIVRKINITIMWD